MLSIRNADPDIAEAPEPPADIPGPAGGAPGPAAGSSARPGPPPPVDSAILDGAAQAVVDLGVQRVTVAEVARRAGVSRPTVYRRWSGVEDVLAALLTREILEVADHLPPEAHDRADLVDHIVDVTWQLGRHEVLHTVLHQSPEIFRTYVLTRLGASQRALIDVLATRIAPLQKRGAVRPGAPDQLATMVLLMAQSAMQSAQVVAPVLDARALSAELTHALNGYLAP